MKTFVKDVMTTRVISAKRETPLAAIARLQAVDVSPRC